MFSASSLHEVSCYYVYQSLLTESFYLIIIPVFTWGRRRSHTSQRRWGPSSPDEPKRWRSWCLRARNPAGPHGYGSCQEGQPRVVGRGSGSEGSSSAWTPVDSDKVTSFYATVFRIIGTLWGNAPLTDGFPLQSNAEFWGLICCWPKQAVEQTVEMQILGNRN